MTAKQNKMKNILTFIITVFSVGSIANAQSNKDLTSHFEKYYSQMLAQGDVQGIISALTHLNILEPNVARQDTLAAYYMNDGKHLQALNTIGIDANDSDSMLAVEVKAISLQALGQNELALVQFEKLFLKNPNVAIAYEIADLKIQADDLTGARMKITYGLANSTDEMTHTYYETQQPYQVSMKSAFTYLEGILIFKESPEKNIDKAVAKLDLALASDPNFNLASLSKNALLSRKEQTKE